MKRAAVLLLAARLWASSDAGDLQAVVVRPGDTLWSIAHRYLKNPERWDEILKYNRLPSTDPTVALPGMTLRVPVRLIKEELRAAHLIYRLNKVLYRRKQTADWLSAPQDMELFRDDSLRTLADSKAKVRFLSDDFLQLEANSMAIIKPVNKDYDVELKRGGTYVGRAKIVTASAKITPETKDTKYAATVRNDLSTLVEVYSGKANVEAQGETVAVPAGMKTDVKMGLAPSIPSNIPDLPAFHAKIAEFTGDSGARAKIAVAAAPREVPPGAAPEGGTPDIARIKTDVETLVVGMPISGYRVQFSRTDDFSQPLFDKTYDADTPVRTSDIQIPKGEYKVRFAIIDLLGTQEKFGPPKLYSLGLRLSKAQIKSQLTILQPGEGEVFSTPTCRVRGRATGEITSVLVNGQGARIDPEGNFSAAVPLNRGENKINVTILNEDGNTDSMVRRVKYEP